MSLQRLPLIRRLCVFAPLTAATAVAGYLAWRVAGLHRLPAGCGPSSGCAEILAGRFSSLLGIPVSLLALIAYCAIALGVGFPAWRPSAFLRRFGSWLALGGAAWFITLQAAVLRAYCPWCMAAHVLAGTAAVLALCLHERKGDGGWLRKSASPALLAAACVASMATIQWNSPHTASPGVARLVGSVACQVDSTRNSGDPWIGRDDAKTVSRPVAVLFMDYACPHCVATATQLAKKADAGEMNLVVLPISIWEADNPHMPSSDGAFKNSLALAAASMAVWNASPDAWPEFHRWLLAGPRTQAAVADKAASIPKAGLPSSGEAAARENIRRFGALLKAAEQVDRLPVVVFQNGTVTFGEME